MDFNAAWDAMYEVWVVPENTGRWSKSSFRRGSAPTVRGRAFARVALRHKA
ncbi:hypothetical protein [Nocardiopsis sp. CC223A]|uniref:hypothetical protein n=1 Tax=Nocardiopsis sp. CC223A TaxID=3044051 RepID=UPI00278BF2E7|nr:hypothetical protein [Nocardiopsis sp. CC223A]